LEGDTIFLKQRLDMLERENVLVKDKIAEIRVAAAQISERQVAMSEKVNKIDAGIGRLLFLVAAGFISAAIMWIIQGGLLTNVGG